MKLQESIMSTFRNKKIIIVSLVIVFLFTSYWVYTAYVKPSLNASYVANKEYAQKDSNNDTADLYLFFAPWCPHCKTARPVWNKFKENIATSGHSSGVKINFIEVDCDKDKSTADRFKVEGYPTIKLNYNNKIVEYDAKPDVDTLQQFLDQTLNQ